MSKLTKQISIDIFCITTFFFLSILFASENVFSLKQWNRKYITVNYSPDKNTITFCFVVVDNYFTSSLKRGYLSMCDFYFTIDEKNYSHLMRIETPEQKVDSTTELRMKYKHIDTILQLIGCNMPLSGSYWRADTDRTVIVKNDFCGNVRIQKNNKKIKVEKFIAFFSVKWHLGEKFKNVKRIKLDGEWKLKEDSPDIFKDIYYDIPSRSLFKSMENQLETNQVKVTANADAIVVTGCESGEKIKVHTITGLEVRTSYITGEVVNIKLPKNHIYTVTVGQARYKVAL